MFKNFVQIVVSFSEANVSNLLIIDNRNSTISFNNKCTRLDSNDFSSFLNTFLEL